MRSGFWLYLACCALPALILAAEPNRFLGMALVAAFALAVVLWPARSRR